MAVDQGSSRPQQLLGVVAQRLDDDPLLAVRRLLDGRPQLLAFGSERLAVDQAPVPETSRCRR